MEQRFNSVLVDYRNVAEMITALPVKELRDIVHAYHYSELLLENELYKDPLSDENLTRFFEETKIAAIVAWRDSRLHFLREHTVLGKNPLSAMGILTSCVVKCACMRVTCYYGILPMGSGCCCGWPLPLGKNWR